MRVSFRREDADVKVFPKSEKTTKEDTAARVISMRGERFNIEVGRYLRPIEEKIFEAIGSLFDHRTVFKGMNAVDQAKLMREKWDMFTNPVAVGLDASRFDQHVSREALVWEHSIYKECFKGTRHREQLGKILNLQLKNHCKGYTEDGSISYVVDGVRMSGDMNTSLGACLIMSCMIWTYAKSLGIRVQLANNGDDCVVFMESSMLDKFTRGLSKWFRDMGFTMKVEDPCYQFEEIEFCQTHPIWVVSGHSDYIMVRDPFKGIAKDTACLHPWTTEKMFRGWLDAVGTGGLSLTGGVPIFQDFYKMYQLHGKYWKGAWSDFSWGRRSLMQGVKREYSDIHPRTRASFYWAFGITPDAQIVIEKYYRECKIDFTLGFGDVIFQCPQPY